MEPELAAGISYKAVQDTISAAEVTISKAEDISTDCWSVN
jgi:hypothetical protein